MDLLQTWLIVGVPGLIITGALFTGHSRTRAILGYLLLVALVLTFLLVPGDVISAAAVGLIAFLLVATGRGMQAEDEPEHHETRDRFTTAAHD